MSIYESQLTKSSMIEALAVIRRFLFFETRIQIGSPKTNLSIEEASSVICRFKLIVDVAAAPDMDSYKLIIYCSMEVDLLVNILR